MKFYMKIKFGQARINVHSLVLLLVWVSTSSRQGIEVSKAHISSVFPLDAVTESAKKI
jgi:hypothetical protein